MKLFENFGKIIIVSVLILIGLFVIEMIASNDFWFYIEKEVSK